MEKQVPAGISNILEQIVQRNQEARRKAEAERERWPLAKALYKKAKAVVEEYGIEQKDGKIVFSRETPRVKLAFGDQRLEFMVREGYSHTYERFRKIQIHRKKEGDDYFTTPSLFTISLFEHDENSGTLKTPLEDSAGPEAIQAVSDLLDVMQQSLSETHIPRSQQIKPEEPKKRLTTVLRRLTSVLRKD